MTNIINIPQPIDAIKSDLEHGYRLTQLHQNNGLRHAQGWVSTVIDYVLLIIPLVAPIPNLINLKIALTPVMGWWASLIAAFAFELLLFGSAEIILYLQGRQMRYGGYKMALNIAVGCGAAFITILLTLIFTYEVPEHGWAVTTLPFVSVIAIAFLSLKKWADIKDSIDREKESQENHVDERVLAIENELSIEREKTSKMMAEKQEEITSAKASESNRFRSFEEDSKRNLERLEKRLAEQERERLAERNEFERTIDGLNRSAQSFEASTSEKNAEIDKLNARIVALLEQSAEQRGQLKTRSNEQAANRSQGKRSNARTNADERQIMSEILAHYQANPKCSLGRANSELGYAKSTISKYLEKLSGAGQMVKGDDGKWTAV